MSIDDECGYDEYDPDDDPVEALKEAKTDQEHYGIDVDKGMFMRGFSKRYKPVLADEDVRSKAETEAKNNALIARLNHKDRKKAYDSTMREHGFFPKYERQKRRR